MKARTVILWEHGCKLSIMASVQAVVSCYAGFMWCSRWLSSWLGGLLPSKTHPAGGWSDKGCCCDIWPTQTDILSRGENVCFVFGLTHLPKSVANFWTVCFVSWRSCRCRVQLWSLKSLWKPCQCCATLQTTQTGMAPWNSLGYALVEVYSVLHWETRCSWPKECVSLQHQHYQSNVVHP